MSTKKVIGQKTVAFVDQVVGKIISRKFQVWLICTIAFYMKMMGEENYIIISCIYMGLETVIDLNLFTRSIKSGKQDPQSNSTDYGV